MTTKKERIDKHRREALQQAAERTHAALLVTRGTAGAPSLDKILGDIEEALGMMHDPDLPERQADSPYLYLDWGGVLLYINLNGSPWPTFTVYVPATPTLYWMPEEGM